MANAAGMIYESIWRDGDWRKLSMRAQRLYMQLLSQKELDCAGILPLQPDKWATGCDELTVEQVWEDLNELQDNRFVYYDADTYETFIRTYTRNSNVMKVPNMRKSACRSALLVGSDIIKPILAAELRATGDPDCFEVAEKINPWPTVTEPFRNPSVTLPKKPSSEPFANPSVTLPEPTGVGKGKGVTHLGNNLRGEGRPQCSRHPQGTDDPCPGCRRVREWDERHADDDAKRAKGDRRTRIDNCLLCDDNGMTETAHGLIRCDHTTVLTVVPGA